MSARRGRARPSRHPRGPPGRASSPARGRRGCDGRPLHLRADECDRRWCWRMSGMRIRREPAYRFEDVHAHATGGGHVVRSDEFPDVENVLSRSRVKYESPVGVHWDERLRRSSSICRRCRRVGAETERPARRSSIRTALPPSGGTRQSLLRSAQRSGRP